MSASEPNALRIAMKASRGRLYMVAFFSLFINLLMLAGPLYMLQVYDRVLTSNSLETLIALSVLLLGLFVASGCLEFARTRILSRVGTRLEAQVAPPAFDAAVRKRLAQSSDDGDESLADTAALRDFMSGNGPPAFFDLPWAPIYLVILAILHPALGLLGLGGTVFVVILAWCNNFSTRAPWGRYAESAAAARATASASQKNAEVIKAMGMAPALRHVWLRHHLRSDTDKGTANDWSGTFSVFSKTSRLLLQSAALGLGAALVIAGEMTAGAMIAGTILLGRALAPVDQSINHWRGYLGAKAAYARIDALLTSYPPAERRLSQSPARKRINVERVFAGPPGARKAVVSNINFSLTAGEAAAIIGPSASGKSTLARLLSGVWIPQAGDVRLDGIAYDQWNSDEIGAQMGYLPQDVELFDGTIAQNIARFQIDAADMEIVAAAEAAGVHDMILQMPEGYETEIGEGGRCLSGGQRQRLGLARALFREPFLVVLDEPNASLDSAGDDALAGAIDAIRERGGIVIVISHRPGVVEAVDKVLVMDEGRQRAFGPAAQIIGHTNQHVGVQGSNVTPMVKHIV